MPLKQIRYNVSKGWFTFIPTPLVITICTNRQNFSANYIANISYKMQCDTQILRIFMMVMLINSFEIRWIKIPAILICEFLFIELIRFDCGSGTGKVRSDTEVMLNQWNTMTVYRYRWDAWIQLNNGQRVLGRSKVN